MQDDHVPATEKPVCRTPWNKGKLVGAKPPLREPKSGSTFARTFEDRKHRSLSRHRGGRRACHSGARRRLKYPDRADHLCPPDRGKVVARSSRPTRFMICNTIKWSVIPQSFDHIVGARERGRDCEVQHVGGPQVDHRSNFVGWCASPSATRRAMACKSSGTGSNGRGDRRPPGRILASSAGVARRALQSWTRSTPRCGQSKMRL